MKGILLRLAAVMVALGAAQPALADWTHEASGISIPDTVGEMTRGDTRDLSGKMTDNILQYGAGQTLVTVYVYQSAFPNPALWYSHTLAVMGPNVGSFDASVRPREFTVAGAPRANGLRAAFDIASGQYKSTAVALFQVNHWIVKIRVTSATLDRAGAEARVDQLLAAMHFARPSVNPTPLVVPTACDVDSVYTGRQLDEGKTRRLLAPATLMTMAVDGDVRGHSGLARDPQSWCQMKVDGLPEGTFAAYRRRDGLDFVVLAGDAGKAIETRQLEGTRPPAVALFGSDSNETRLAALFDAEPDIKQATVTAITVMMGRGPAPLASAHVEDAQDARSEQGAQ